MKKKSIVIIMSLVLLLAFSTAMVFAVKAGEMEFTGTEMKLSLEDAKKAMLSSGIDIEAAKITLKSDKAKSATYYERLAGLYRQEAMADEARAAGLSGLVSGPSNNAKILADMAGAYAKEQAQRNYDAAVNKIVRATVDSYYKLALAKERLRISNENVAAQDKLYQNTQSKFNLGVVAKQDVLTAEFGLNDAKVKAEQAANDYTVARMGFNIQYGFDLMQDVTITDSLEEAALSKISLSEAITLALANRNEMHEADFSLKSEEISFDSVKKTKSSNTSAYMNEAVRMASVQAAAVSVPKSIEMDIRKKYLDMTQKASEVELYKLSVANAKESYRLAGLQYDAGMTTLNDTQQIQIKAYQAELSYYSTLLEYNLAILDYEQATTVGTSSGKIQ